MTINFDVLAISAELVYDNLAAPLLLSLKEQYELEGLEPADHWVMWEFENGLSVPVPTSITESTLPIPRILQMSYASMLATYKTNCRFETRMVMQRALDSIDDLLSPRMAYAA